jgi:hypothetical protein
MIFFLAQCRETRQVAPSREVRVSGHLLSDEQSVRDPDAHYYTAVAHLPGQYYCTVMGRFLGELWDGGLSGAMVPGSLPGSWDLKMGSRDASSQLLTGV